MNPVHPESERRQATILFADIAGFTSMSEKLDPEEMTTIMDDCFALLGQIVAEYGGVIDKFIGDCVMALFGVPKALEGAPQKAISAALKMVKEIAAYSERRRLAIPLGIHIGINSGEVLSGEVGSADKRDFTVMGDAVNLASRLKDLAERGQVFVGPLTWRSARGSFRFVPLKPMSVKGKAEPVQVYEATGILEDAAAGSSDRMIQSVLVGRDLELKRLELQVTRLAEGEGTVVDLVGEAGIGKSRLCAELFAKDFMAGVTVLEGRALAVGQSLSWYPIIGILKSWASISDDDAEPRAFLKLESAIRAVCPEEAEEIVPYIATLMGYRLTGKYAAALEGVRGESLGKIIAKHLKDLIAKASAFRPILFVLEDLHWADESTLELLRSLVALTAKHPVAFLCAWRPGYEETTEKFHAFIAENLPDRLVDIELSPLEGGQSEELARNLLRNAGVPERVVGRIIEKSGGNPFFIEEVIRSFIDMGVMTAGKGGLTVSADIEAVEIPSSIDAVIMSRVDRLDEETKELLRLASVIGRSFFFRILSGVAEAGEDLGGCIEGLKEMQLIRERLRIGEIEYLFKHVLVQETIYNSILIRTRKLLHLKVACAIEEAFADRLPEFYGVLAFHYSQGEDLDKAEHYLEKAGQAALCSAASSEALTLYQKALTLYKAKVASSAEPRRMFALERNIAQAFYFKGLFLEAVEHYDAALSLAGAGRGGKLSVIMDILVGFASFIAYAYFPFLRSKKQPAEIEIELIKIMSEKTWAIMRLDTNGAVACGFGLLRRYFLRNFLPVIGPSMLCTIVQWICGAGLFPGLADKVLGAIETELRSEADHSVFLDAGHWLYFVSGRRLSPYSKQLVEQFIGMGDLGRLNYYLAMWGQHFVFEGRLDEATEAAKLMADLSEAYENADLKCACLDTRIQIFLMRKSTREAIEVASELVSLGRDLGEHAYRKTHLSYLADAHILNGGSAALPDLVKEMETLIDEERLLPPIQSLPPLMSVVAYYVSLLEGETRPRRKGAGGEGCGLFSKNAGLCERLHAAASRGAQHRGIALLAGRAAAEGYGSLENKSFMEPKNGLKTGRRADLL